ncbi:hypothetical protein EVAR_50633_1 [Eumeta japonica]|uniref:Uncharacterized protein n=1 Tax=Eumeta variegata TaxID=151549 RepID=A0A4C1XJX8_EUMVA|nr:hypothetical protein EVAR_50633_1 [Eumeta japonica]
MPPVQDDQVICAVGMQIASDEGKARLKAMNTGNEVNGVSLAIRNIKKVSRKVRSAIYKSHLMYETQQRVVLLPNESWLWQKKNESRIKAMEMRSLRSMCEVYERWVRNSEIRERGNMCDGKVGKGRPRNSCADQTDGISKKHPKPTILHENIGECH